ncbi:MAG TPA: SDR family oxidoreductase [Sphingomonadaceae bacterium]|nr:SDR family oxidoreductase [Sphingomonadaceae bacterium]
MHDLFSLAGQSAIVTGGSRGLGLAIAELFAAAGAHVMIASEDADACAAAQSRLAAKGYAIAWRKCDVTDRAEQEALVEATADRFGGIDILVANAGISGPMVGSVDLDPSAYRQVLAVNLDSIVELCALAVPHLRRRGGGSILLMSSLSALRGNRSIGAYSLAKAALAQLARNLAVELGPDNIRANAIAPGFIRTDLAAPLLADAGFMARRMQMTPLRRPGTPEEVAGAALFLASRAGGFVTGHTLVVDGGTLITDGS